MWEYKLSHEMYWLAILSVCQFLVFLIIIICCREQILTPSSIYVRGWKSFVKTACLLFFRHFCGTIAKNIPGGTLSSLHSKKFYCQLLHLSLTLAFETQDGEKTSPTGQWSRASFYTLLHNCIIINIIT